MIRQATLDDGPRLFHMACRFMAETRYGVLFAPNHAALAQLISLVLERGVVFVDELEHANDCASWCDHPAGHACTLSEHQCNCGRGIIGMIGLITAPNILTGLPYGDEIAWWVEPEHRRTRSAYRLLRAAIDWARQNGLSVLKMVAPAGTEIGAFYESLGFTLVESAYQLVIT